MHLLTLEERLDLLEKKIDLNYECNKYIMTFFYEYMMIEVDTQTESNRRMVTKFYEVWEKLQNYEQKLYS